LLRVALLKRKLAELLSRTLTGCAFHASSTIRSRFDRHAPIASTYEERLVGAAQRRRRS
jgi:hypothetical protein